MNNYESGATIGRFEQGKTRQEVLSLKESYPTSHGLIIIGGEFRGDSLFEEIVFNPDNAEVVETGPPGAGKSTIASEEHECSLKHGISSTLTFYDLFIQRKKKQILGPSYTNRPVNWTPEDLHGISDDYYRYIMSTLARPGEKNFREVPGVGNTDTFDFGITTVRKLVATIYGGIEFDLGPNINRENIEAMREVNGLIVKSVVPDPRNQLRAADLRTTFKPERRQETSGEEYYCLPNISPDIKALSLDSLLRHAEHIWRKKYRVEKAAEIRKAFTPEIKQDASIEEYYQLPNFSPDVRSTRVENLLAQIEDILRRRYKINVIWITPPESLEEGGRIIIKALDEAAPKRVIDLISAAMKEQVVGIDFPDIPPLPPLPKGYPYAEMTPEMEAELQWNIRYAEMEMDHLYSLGLPRDRGIIVLNPYSNRTTNWFLSGRAEEQQAS